MVVNKMDLERARAAFEVAKKEFSRANTNYLAAQKAAKSVINNCATLEELRRADSELKKASDYEYKCKKTFNIARVVYFVAGENVAAAAANVLLRALGDNEKMRNTPVHYKKFKNFVSCLLGNDFYFSVSDYSFYIYFTKAEYKHNAAFVAAKNDGVVHLPDVVTYKYIATIDEIKEEAARAAAYSEALTAKVDALRDSCKTEENSYKTNVRYLLPHLNYHAITKNYDF